MSHTSQPDRIDLEELERAETRRPIDRRQLPIAALLGAALALALGFGTDIFQSGPTEADLNRAFQRGAEQGSAAVETAWQNELVRREQIGFSRGRSAASHVTIDDIDRFRHGFTYEAAYDQVLQLTERELFNSWLEGWEAGYRAAGLTIRGSLPDQRSTDEPALRQP